MSCKIKTLTIDYLKKQEAITDKKVIANPALFEQLNEELTLLARNKYNVGDGSTKLFSTKDRVNTRLDGSYSYKYVYETNDKLFDLLDEAVDHYNSEKAKRSKKKVQAADSVMAAPKRSVDPEISAKWFRGEEKTTINQVLEDIIKSDSPLASLAKELQPKISINASIVLTELSEDTAGVYDALGGYISINKRGRFSKGRAETTILHEILHHLTFQELKNNTSENTKALNSLYQHALKHLNKEEHYSLKDVDEFAVGVFTNAEFIVALKGIPPVGDVKTGNLFTQLIEYLTNLLGLDNAESLYEQSAHVVAGIIEDNFQNLEQGTVEAKKLMDNSAPFEDYLRYEKVDESKSLEDAYDPNEEDSVTQEEEEVLTEVLEEAGIETGFVKLGNISEKLDHSIRLINKSIDINLEKYKNLQKVYSTRDPEKASNIEDYRIGLQELKTKIAEYKEADRLKAIVEFVERMAGNMKYVESKLDSVDQNDAKSVFYAVKNYDAYLKAYGVINELKKNVAYIREKGDQDLVTKDELKEIEEKVLSAETKYSYLKTRVHEMMKNYLRQALNDPKHHEDVIYKHRERLRKEHSANKLPKSGQDAWITQQMNFRDKDLIQEDVEKATNSLLEDPSFDISAANTMLVSSINTNDKMIQIQERLFVDITNKRLEIERVKDREFKELFEEVVKALNTNSINKMYKNIYQKGKNGKFYLLGDYSVDFLTIKDKELELKDKMQQALRKEGINSDKFTQAKSELAEYRNEHFIEIEGKWTPKDKYKNDLSKLSPAEKKMRDFFIEITEGSAKDTSYQRTLIRYVGAAKFYELPKVTKSDAERVWTGSLKGAAKDKYKDLTTVRTDDVGYVERNVDGDGNPLYNIPIHYRDSKDNPMDPSQQSLDLFSIYRKEFKNGVTHKLRAEAEMKLDMLKEVAKSKKFYDSQGTTRFLDRGTGKLSTKEGHESQVYKMMTNMMEARLYDMLHKTGNKINKLDLNKAVGFVNGITAFLGMTFNIASGTANVVNANAQMFLEGFIKGHFITAEGVKKANALYGKHLAETVKDNTRPINNSFTNQILELFDAKGLFDLSEADFLESDLLKAGVSRKTLQVFQTSGENWITAVTTMAVLHGIKVMNSKSQFINKEGNVVETKEEAASLLDMLETDDRGMVKMSDKVAYTTHSKMTTWNEGGKAMVDSLIRKKLYDTIGNYTETSQTEIMRHWWGKLFMMYRKYLVPMAVSRFTGVMTVHKASEDLDAGETNFSYALQENEEGTYVSLARYLIQAIKDGQFFVSSQNNWHKLSDYEKHNIKRAVTELVVSFAMIPLVTALLGAIADEDDDAIWFIMYQLRRLDSELSQYRSVTEAFKVLRSPIPSTRLLEVAGETIINVFDPTAVYESGKHEGKNKFFIRLGKQTPVIKDVLRSYKDLFEFQDSSWGTRM